MNLSSSVSRFISLAALLSVGAFIAVSKSDKGKLVMMKSVVHVAKVANRRKLRTTEVDESKISDFVAGTRACYGYSNSGGTAQGQGLACLIDVLKQTRIITDGTAIDSWKNNDSIRKVFDTEARMPRKEVNRLTSRVLSITRGSRMSQVRENLFKIL